MCLATTNCVFNNYEVCLVCYLFSSPNEKFVVCLTIKKKQLLHVFWWFIAHLSWRCKWDSLIIVFGCQPVCVYVYLSVCLPFLKHLWVDIFQICRNEGTKRQEKMEASGLVKSQGITEKFEYSHHCNLSHSTHSPINDGIRTVYPLLYIKTSKRTPSRKNMYILISMCKKKKSKHW